MAQEQGQEAPKSIRLIGGLFKDTSHVDQPSGSYRHAKNMTINTVYGANSVEFGNKKIADVSSIGIVIGTIPLDDDRVVYFVLNGSISEIGLLVGETYSTIFSPTSPQATNTNGQLIDVDLKFSPSNPIKGTYKLQADGDIFVYWTDDLNPPRTLNVTRQLNSLPNLLYGRNPINSPDTAFINQLNLFPHAGPVPHIGLDGVYSGGGCKTGVYYLAIAYADDDLTPTNYVSVSNPVSIVDAPEGVYPIETYDGSPANVLTGKSIIWDVSNLNTDKRYIKVSIIKKILGSLSAIDLPLREIGTAANMLITYSGEETESASSLNAVLVDKVEYETSRTIEQLDSALYQGNLTSKTDLGYQKYANFIKANPVTKCFNNFDPFVITGNFLMRRDSDNSVIDQGYRSPKNIYDYRGYQRDEVYAFYIAFILKSGKMSYAYHIPGRTDLGPVPRTSLNEMDSDALDLDPLSPNYGTVLGPATDIKEGVSLYDNWVGAQDLINLTGGASNPQGYPYQWYDFSHLIAEGSRNMNYWKNLNEFYPDTEHFDVVDAQFPLNTQTSLRPTNGVKTSVRHHRFPGNKHRPYSTFQASNSDTTANNLLNNSSPTYTIYWYWVVGFVTYGDGTFFAEGAVPVYDWDRAVELQLANEQEEFNGPIETIGDVGQFHYCDPSQRLWGDSGIEAIFANSGCPIPPGGTAVNGILGDSPTIQFQYSPTGLQPGTPVVFGWNVPNGGMTGCFLNDTEGCSSVGNSTVEEVTSSGIRISTDNMNACHYPNTSWETAGRGGWIAWGSCDYALKDSPNIEDEPFTQSVCALGIQFSDIKIPKSIADQIQGFRIYHAKRTHENRTIIGQAPIHGMGDRKNMDVSGCDGGGTTQGLLDYYLPGGQPNGTIAPTGWTTADIGTQVLKSALYPRELYSFHDFYLLNRRPSLAQATHLRLQYKLEMFNFKGPASYNIDGELSDSENEVFSCLKPEVVTSFHLAGDQRRVINGTFPVKLNWLLRDNAKDYITGNIIHKGDSKGFGGIIYAIGGQSHVALRPLRYLIELPCSFGASWRDVRGDRAKVSYASYTKDDTNFNYEDVVTKESFMVYLANLHAFKTDVYNSIETQSLVWTGYEVLGTDINRFVVDENGVPISSIPTPIQVIDGTTYGNNPVTQGGVSIPSQWGNPVAYGNFQTSSIFGGDTFICRYGYRMTHREEVNSIKNSSTGLNMGSIDNKSVIMSIVESSENINFRHIENLPEPYFPGDSLANVLKVKADTDLTYNPDQETGKIKYNEDYSSENDLKVVLPFPFYLTQPEVHTARVIRSARTTSGSIVDNYRIWQVEQSKELNNKYGKLEKISAISNLLLFHMENGLYITKGKQTMKTSEGEATVGSGDIFTQEPDLIVHNDSGYLGTQSRFADIVTPQGYFFVDMRKLKIFLVSKGAPTELTANEYGLSNWFQANLPFALNQYGYTGGESSHINGLGYHSVWDERYQRVILTKRDLIPTIAFTSNLQKGLNTLSSPGVGIIIVKGNLYSRVNALDAWEPLYPTIYTTYNGEPLFTRSGWTISFLPSSEEKGTVGVWESFHDYIPYMYSYTGVDVLSNNDIGPSNTLILDRGIYKHNDEVNPGLFYNVLYPSEIEVILNMAPTIDKLYSSLSFFTEVFSPSTVRNKKELDAGFTSFILYTDSGMSQVTPIEYLINTRKLGSEWKINEFRDMSAQSVDSSAYFIGPYSGSNYNVPGANIMGNQNTGALTHLSIPNLIVDGMNETVNPAYLNLNKPWYEQRKFTGRYMSVKLICDNTARNWVNLLAVNSEVKAYIR